MKRISKFALTALMLAILFLPACRSAPQNADGSLKVLASTTFLADIAQNVAGDRVHVDSLLPFGADPHAYQAAPADVARIADSDVLILNGIEYERFIQPLLQNAGGKRLIITASDGLDQRTLEENGAQVGDPHMWLDPTRVVKYTENIRDGLIQADPDGAETYSANARAYIAQLNDLDAWIMDQVSTIPVEHRLLVTNHEALGYFSARYGFTVVGTVLPSLSSDASTSAKEMAGLIEEVKAKRAPAIFLAALENPKLADQIAFETGAKVVSDLSLESLTDGPPAATYIEMMKYNVSRIVSALK